MLNNLTQSVKEIEAIGAGHSLAQIYCGIEKESLRILHDGSLSQSEHPTSLGSPLTHPYITTDYSESLI